MKLTNEEKKIINDYLDEERLNRIVLDTSIISWNYLLKEHQISSWLENFSGKFLGDPLVEKKLALWLLAHFTFYTLDDIRILCKEIFRKYIHLKLIERGEQFDNLKDDVNSIIKNTLFLGLGNDSESGNNILYYFRQENELAKGSFEIKKEKYDNIVYIDDVTISGSQATTYMGTNRLEANNIYIATLLATEKAKIDLSKVKIGNSKIKVLSAITLDSRDKAFDSETHIFSDDKIKGLQDLVKKFCIFYGDIAIKGYDDMKGYPLGYDNGEYLIGFEYNTPDNTLPIFWGEGDGWQPLFKRYHKVYSGKEWEIDERKYY